MTKFKRIQKLILTTLCLVLTSCVFLAYSLIGNRADALATLPGITTVADPIYDFENYCYSEESLNSLAKVVLGNNNRSFNDLINYARNTAGTQGQAITNKNITLRYGRYRFTTESSYNDLIWMPVYLSRSTTGDAILTLYLAATTNNTSTVQQENAYFSSYGTYSTDPNCNAPSNSYGTSHIRAVTLGNGSAARELEDGDETGKIYAYYSANTAGGYTPYPVELKESECNKFNDFIQGDDFTGLLYEDLALPKQIAWQANESYADTRYFTGNTYCWPNEAYDTPTTGEYYQPGYFDYNTKGTINYNVWKNDTVWLPSLTEVGTGDIDGNNVDTTNGIWKLTASQRSNVTKSWLRTAKTDEAKNGNAYSAYTMFCTAADGSITSGDVNQRNAVRPAIHLNLSKISTKTTAPVNVPEEVTSTYNGEVQTIDNVPESQLKWYDPEIMTISFFSNAECTRMIAPQDSGSYYMMVQLRNTDRYFLGEDKDTIRKVTKFTIQKAKIQVSFVYDPENPTIPIGAEIVDKENAIYERDVAANIVPEIGLRYSNVAGIALKDPYSYPNVKGTYEAFAYIKNENLFNYNYELSGTVKSTQFLVSEYNVPEPYFIADNLYENESFNQTSTTQDLRLFYRGSRYVQIANVTEYVTITVTTLNVEKDSCVDCILRDDGVQVYLLKDCGNYIFTVSLNDAANTQWESSKEQGLKDTQNRVLTAYVNKAEITVEFADSIPSSWERGRAVEVELIITGIYEQIEGNLEMSVYYQRTGAMYPTYITKNSEGKFILPENLEVGTYTLGAVIADDGQWTSNYMMHDAVTRKFEIKNMDINLSNDSIIWTYKVNGVRPNPIPNIRYNEHSSQSNPLKLEYGGAYEFSLTMDEGSFTSQYLRAIYTGDTYISDAGLHSVTVRITAYNKYVNFEDKVYTIYFEIAKTTYDLSGVQWKYTSPFTYTGSEHRVIIDPDTLPEGLTATYTTSGVSTNAAINGGTYTTLVSFVVADDYAKNYITPDMYDPSTYKDPNNSFNFSLEWKIDPKTIEVSWTENTSSSTIFFVPTLVSGHSYVDYTYEKRSGGSWVACEGVTVPSGASDTYRVKPAVKSEYSGNYTLNSEEWYEFEVESGKQPVTIHFEINSVVLNEGDVITYTGNAFAVRPVVDSGTVNMTGSTVNYYRRTPSGIRGEEIQAPVNVGLYVAVVSDLTFDSGYLAGGETEINFEIGKADYDMSKLKWQYTHNGKTVTASYDPEMGKWVDAQGAEFKFSFEYDGTVHKLDLVGIQNIPGITASDISDEGKINAGSYSSYVYFNYDTANYNNPSSSFPNIIEWTIEKAEIHFDQVKWGYEDEDGNEHEFDFENDVFTFTRTAEGLVHYTVKLINLPAGINIQYSTINMQKVDSTAVTGNCFGAIGQYRTSFNNTSINFAGDSNYKPYSGSLPASIPTFCIWEIVSRELTQPVYDGSWLTFDDKVHDLLSMCNIPEDELPYYDIEILFVDKEYMIYEGYAGYNDVPYSGYDAGTYTIRFYELQGEEANKVIKWQIEIVIDKESLEVTWDLNGSIPIARVIGVYVSDMLDTEYINENGGKVTLAYVQTTDGMTFVASPCITPAYSKNLTFVMAEGQNPTVEFTTSQYKSTDQSHQLTRPALLETSKEYTGMPITFVIGSWDIAYKDYLYLSGDDLTQTEVGTYTVTVSFQKEADAYWSGTNDNRNSINLTFEITRPSRTGIDYPEFDITFAEYTGEVISFTIKNWVSFQTYLSYEIGDLVEIHNGVLGQSKPGVYTVIFSFLDDSMGYWKATGGRESYSIDITISGDGDVTTIAKPTLQRTSAAWTGNVIGFALNNENYYKQYLEVTAGSPMATNPGTYEVTYSIKSGLGITFSDGTTSVTLKYTITPPNDPNAAVKLEKPVLANSSMPYTGTEITFRIVDWDNLSLFLEITEGSLTKTSAGDYSVTIGFKETSRATWADGSRELYRLEFHITQGEVKEPIKLDIVGMVQDTKEFTGDFITFEIEKFLDNYDQYLKIDKGNTYLITQKDIGEYSFYLQIKDPTVAVWANGTTTDILLRFYIVKATADVDNITMGEGGSLVVKNGDDSDMKLDDYIEYVYFDKDGNMVSRDDLVDGEEYTATAKIKDDKLEEFYKNIENAEAVKEKIESSSYTFIYRSPSSGLSLDLIVTIAVVGVLVLLVIATIIVLAVKRKQYAEEDDYVIVEDDYEDDD